ncbi:MAG: hypothetical protein WCI48_13680 [Bacteroidota bacterium]
MPLPDHIKVALPEAMIPFWQSLMQQVNDYGVHILEVRIEKTYIHALLTKVETFIFQETPHQLLESQQQVRTSQFMEVVLTTVFLRNLIRQVIDFGELIMEALAMIIMDLLQSINMGIYFYRDILPQILVLQLRVPISLIDITPVKTRFLQNLIVMGFGSGRHIMEVKLMMKFITVRPIPQAACILGVALLLRIMWQVWVHFNRPMEEGLMMLF